MSSHHTGGRDVLSFKSKIMRQMQEQSEKLNVENKKMEERLFELRVAMTREKEEREKSGGGFWKSGQVGTLSKYAVEVVYKPSCQEKKASKTKVKLLKDEDAVLPQQKLEKASSIASVFTEKKGASSNVSPSNPPAGRKGGKAKVLKCGQCEEKPAALKCLQCVEEYCPSCFAAFHKKGALKKHRSVSLQTCSTPRHCMPSQLIKRHPVVKASFCPHRTDITQWAPAASFASSSLGHNEEKKPPVNSSFTGAAAPPDEFLLHGTYDEAQSAASFQQALQAWRGADAVANDQLENSQVTPVECTDSSTATVGEIMNNHKPLNIKFNTHSLTYAEHLLLKRHRRTEVPRLPTPLVSLQLETDHNFSCIITEDMKETVERVSFEALFKAIKSIIEAQCPPGDAGVSVVQKQPVLQMSRNMPRVQTSSECDGKNGDNDICDEANNSTSSPSVTHLPNKETYDDSKVSSSFLKEANKWVSCENWVCDDSTSSTTIQAPACQLNKQEQHIKRKTLCKAEKPPMNSAKGQATERRRPLSGKISRNNSRTSSRSKSRASVMQLEGHITRQVSEDLSSVARREPAPVGSCNNSLQSFFMAGVPSEQPLHAPIKAQKSKPADVKVSYKLYQMAPRSWRPSSSFRNAEDAGKIVSKGDDVLSWSCSRQVAGTPTSINYSVSSRCNSQNGLKAHISAYYSPISELPVGQQSRTPLSMTSRITSPSLCSVTSCDSRLSTRFSVIGGQTRSSVTMLTPTPRSGSKQEKKIVGSILIDGEDFSKFDETDTFEDQDRDDTETLCQLQWELASESGWTTDDGKSSRLSTLDTESDYSSEDDHSGIPTEMQPSLYSKITDNNGNDGIFKLREEELMCDFEEMEKKLLEEEEVKALK